jgi:putative transposase
MISTKELVDTGVAVTAACVAAGLCRASYYRFHAITVKFKKVHPAPARALTERERQRVLAILNQPRFCDMTPREVWATLADEGKVPCSIRTMYRILKKENAVRERRNCAKHKNHPKPTLRATAPNQVWAWDITKIKGPQSYSYFYLYTIVDLYSRKVLGWTLAPRESGKLAKKLFQETCSREKIDPDQLSVHSDRGSAMTSITLALLFANLGILKSLSRPRVSNDNAFVESLFKTLKYRHVYPERFSDIASARAYLVRFFDWYNYEHFHSGIALLTPHTVHAGLVQKVCARRQKALDRAYTAHPERYVKGKPVVAMPAAEVWINKPELEQLTNIAA